MCRITLPERRSRIADRFNGQGSSAHPAAPSCCSRQRTAPGTVLGILVAGEFASSVGVIWLDIAAAAIFAQEIPDHLRSRVAGAYRTVNYGVRPPSAPSSAASSAPRSACAKRCGSRDRHVMRRTTPPAPGRAQPANRRTARSAGLVRAGGTRPRPRVGPSGARRRREHRVERFGGPGAQTANP